MQYTHPNNTIYLKAMSIRRRTSTSIVDIWLTNNSNDVNVVGSLRWAVAQASSTLPTYIKVAPDFIDLAGVGRNMYVAGSKVTNVIGGTKKDITIDFSYINVLIDTGGGFSGVPTRPSPTFKLQNMVVENQDFGTSGYIFNGITDFTNCRFENLVLNSASGFFDYIITTITNCIFRNVVNNGGKTLIFDTAIVTDCIFDETVNIYGAANFSKCYISVSNTLVLASSSPSSFNFSQCHIRNSGTNTAIGLFTRNYGTFTNCTLVNMRIAASGGYGEKPGNIHHCTQIYTLPITASTPIN